MTLLNLAEPLTKEDISAIAALSGKTVRKLLQIKPVFSDRLPLVPQVRTFISGLDMSEKEWKSTSLVVCLPADSVVAAIMVAEIAGRRGRTPSVVRFIRDGNTGRPEPSEVISLHEVRKEVRQERQGWVPPAKPNSAGF